jgi:hypothetical protein
VLPTGGSLPSFPGFRSPEQATSKTFVCGLPEESTCRDISSATLNGLFLDQKGLSRADLKPNDISGFFHHLTP